MRKPLIAANWKMNKNIGEAMSFAGAFGGILFDRFQEDEMPVDVLVCPLFWAFLHFAQYFPESL